MTNWTGNWHPLAERFPMLDEDELREMAASIAEHGQYVPCRMSPEGLGLDGRNRVAACALADVKPQWEIYDGDLVAFIVEVNAERRHLSTGQRAMAVAIGLVDEGKRHNGKFETRSVPAANGRTSVTAWAKAVQLAGIVLDHAPELADPVLRGEVALDAAHKEADERRQAKKRITDLGGELSALVETGVIDVAEAERRADEERRFETLTPDLVTRVRDGALKLDEAEMIHAQNEQRIDEWASRVRDGLTVLGRMAAHPIPGGIRGRLTDNEGERLVAVLDVLKSFEEGDTT